MAAEKFVFRTPVLSLAIVAVTSEDSPKYCMPRWCRP